MNRDFDEMLSALFAAGAEFLVVGAHALAAHGFPRATGDLDLWVNATPENAERVWAALVAFGAPLGDLSIDELSRPGIIFQMGLPPHRIDVLTKIDGVEFADAWTRRLDATIDGRSLPLLGRVDMITNKRAAGRPKDLVDLEALQSDGARK